MRPARGRADKCMARPSPRRRAPAFAAACLAMWVFPHTAFSQVQPSVPQGSLTTIVRGELVDSSGSPVPNVLVTIVSDLHRTTRQERSDQHGRFRVPAPTTTGGFTLILAGGGISDRLLRASGHPVIDLGRIVVDRTAQQLAPVRVRARRIAPEFPGSAPGTGRAFPGSELFSDYLSELSSLDAIGLLVPGLVIEAGEGGRTSLSVPGVGAGQNNLMLDGSRYTGLIPRDAIASATVGTTAGAAHGRFAGAEVSAQTAKGSGIPRFTVRSTLYSPAVSGSGARGMSSMDAFPFVLGASATGPLRRPEWSFFAASELGRHSTAVNTLALDAPRGSGLTDSLFVLNEILRLLGVPDRGSVRSGTTFATGLLNLSYYGGPSSIRHIRVNGFSSLGPTIPAFAVSTAAGTFRRDGAQLHADFTRSIRARVLNESRVAVSRDSRSERPLLALPRGEVSVGGAGETALSALTFGGAGFGAQQRTRSSVEAATAFSWERSTHRFNLGFDALMDAFSRLEERAGSGRFSFSSLAALAVNQPAGFSRIVRGFARGSQSDVNVFASHLWSARDGLRLQSGLRWESAWLTARGAGGSASPGAVAPPPTRISETMLLPRTALTWRYGGTSAGRPLGEVRASAGAYRGLLPADLAQQIAADGSTSATYCSGADVPIPRWSDNTGYDCAGSVFSVTEKALLSSDVRAPLTWRGTFEISLPTRTRAALTLRANASRTSNLLGEVDLNARADPVFALDNEGGRPVYVEPADIATETGIPSIVSSRIDPVVGRVLQYRSDLAANAAQLMLELWVPPAARGGARWQATYVHTRVTERRRRSDLVDNPFALHSGTGLTGRSHQLHILATAPRNRFADINLLATVFSGMPFTPLVKSDIDGDGFSDDPAFVFASGSRDTAAYTALQTLQASATSGVRRCLLGNADRVAAANSCRGPWSGRLDVIARLRAGAFPGTRRATIEIRATNVLAGLDRLLNGADGLRGWSPGGFVDPVLWIPQGFDPTRNRYSYAVNSNFGKSPPSLNPFAISVDVRIPLGPDPQRSGLLMLIGRSPGQARQPTLGQLESSLARSLPNPMALILARRDTLGLTREQVARIQAIDVAYQAEVESLVKPLAAELAALPKDFRSHDVVRRVNEAFFDLQRRQMRWGDEIHDILSPSQRQRLPLYVQHVLYDSEEDLETILR